MEELELARQVATQVVSDTKFWIALIGLLGGIAGTLLTFGGNWLLHHIQSRPQKALDAARKKVLLDMLEDDRFAQKWRKLDTLAAVIGASDEETKRLLIELGARGSEKGDGKWGLIKYHPLPASE
jgi:hypothetical protein